MTAAVPPVPPVPDLPPGEVRLLVGMSVREASHAGRMAAMADALGAQVAYLQVGDPSLSAALTRLADEGVERVVLLGVSLGTLAPANSWLRRIAGHWWRERGETSGHRPVVAVATTLLRHESDLELGVLDVTRPIHGAEAPLTSAAWEDVPGHRHHVLVCRGPRCSAQGADATAEALGRALRARDLGDDDVLVTQTGCLFPCNHAPVVCVQPDDSWYARLGADDVDALVDSHLVEGVPLAAKRLERRRPEQP
ncbi:(2Fe-2S) ferredoxin domain-containing protein [Nocardioides zeae]|uniref:(2Fe-2S) ferredoxin domain-containing protein n=1 Tax=Nocardioides imazamoxiresistens TaxID=3231893 RepID=A0ABU3PYS4_9ACTN|nr:(2Fe-2S) ferredoxin domain-containing protein [Nocardioides zeae]MDT9594274.1 (2Fe-2S) ferredoxin domain-containing protein [Nocardioides zeae]